MQHPQPVCGAGIGAVARFATDDRQPTGHCLLNNERKTLPHTRQQQKVSPPIKIGQSLRALGAKIMNVGEPPFAGADRTRCPP